MSRKILTEAQAKIWLENFYKAEEEAAMLSKCALWAVMELAQFRKNLQGESNVIALDGTKLFKTTTMPFPDKKMRNFQELGKNMDKLFHNLNKLLPEE